MNPSAPFFQNAPITQRFGEKNPSYKSGIHMGVDFAVQVGSDLLAPCDGRIYRVFRGHPSLGNAIYMKVHDGLYLAFLHCSQVVDPRYVKEGDWMGYTGNTGRSEGPHCHVEAWKVPINRALLFTEKGVRDNLIDPLTIAL